MMKADELRKKYLEFFKSKGHAIIPSASLVPENDPSVLFTTAGMHPLVPYLMGEKHPAGDKLVNVQKCVRTGDIDEVGDLTHHTFFEMLGNWSLGDYFKKESIEMSWEFLTSPDWLNLDKNRIAVSVFAGDLDAPFDEESFEIWKKIGMPEKLIAKLPKENNWWGMEKGPCGADTEIFYWTGDSNKIPDSFNDDNDSWVEIWNNVFMEFNKLENGKLEPLAQKNVDTGMGMERILAAINNFPDNYQTDLFWPIIQKIEEISGKKYEDNKKEFRIIADHLKAAVFMISDGVKPSRERQGYVVRKLIRRAIQQGKTINIESNFIVLVAKAIINIYESVYSELNKNKEKIFSELESEEKKYRGGLEKIKKFISNPEGNFWYRKDGENIQQAPVYFNDDAANIIFDLYQTCGFPFEIVFDELKKNGINYNESDKIKLKNKFDIKFKEHQELSRTASVGMFKGGLADSSEKTKQLHTVAHLMLAGLRKVLGESVHQKGSNITEERIRFDFSHPEKMTDEQKKAVEDFVNSAISAKVPVEMKEMTLEEAKEFGAEGAFENKYGERVKVYTIGGDPETSSGLAPYSREICGGPHIENTGDIKGVFKIKKEESSSAGVRRIKAIIG